MILPEKKILFVHIPKCGGTSVAAGLFGKVNINMKTYIKLDKYKQTTYMCDVNQKHAPAWFYKNELKKSYKEYYKFTVIRNPWERAMSSFEWHEKVKFDEFISLIESQSHHQVKPLCHFIMEKNEVILDDIFCFSQIERVADKLKIKRLHRKKRNSKRHFEEMDQDKLEKFDEVVSRIYKDDIEYFGFEKFKPATRNVTVL
jgi:hypothetical protein